MPFRWAYATPTERAECVRNHHKAIAFDNLCELFELTPEGAYAILSGDDWAPRYSLETTASDWNWNEILEAAHA